MSERSAARIDPELRGALAAMPDFDRLSPATLGEYRAALKGAPVADGISNGVSHRWVAIPGGEGPAVRAIFYRPEGRAAPLPAILSIHGGGFVVGDAAREHEAMLALAAATGAAILSVDYRLAPEAPYPGPADDCFDALAWLHREAGDLGIDRARIAVRGVSAGGGLAAGLALRARGRDDLALCLLLLVYPMLDDRTALGAGPDHFVWTRAANAFGWAAFLGDRAGAPPATAVPARADDLAGLPPLFLAVGDADLFCAEDLRFAERAVSAGGAVELHVYPGAFHGFNLVAGTRLAAHFERDVTAAFQRAFAADPLERI